MCLVNSLHMCSNYLFSGGGCMYRSSAASTAALAEVLIASTSLFAVATTLRVWGFILRTTTSQNFEVVPRRARI